MGATFADIVEEIRALDPDSQAEILHLIEAWLAEGRRQEIAHNARQARDAYAAGTLKSGTLDDLMADLYAED